MENYRELENIVEKVNNSELIPKQIKTDGLNGIHAIQSSLNYQIPQNQLMQFLNSNVIPGSPFIFYERWKPITKLSVPKINEGMYYISDRGRIISDARCRRGIKLLDPVETANGYLRVNLRHADGSSLYYSIHRIVKIEFDPIDGFENLQVNHWDGNKHNNWLYNLQWSTGSENILHAYRNGLKYAKCGENAGNATISNQQAEMIGQLISENQFNHVEIAKNIGCPVHIVDSISCGITWKNIYEKYGLEKYKRGFNVNFSDEELHLLFKYFQDHKHIKYRYLNDLYRNALMDLFGITFSQAMSGTMSRLYNRQSRTDISSLYDF